MDGFIHDVGGVVRVAISEIHAASYTLGMEEKCSCVPIILPHAYEYNRSTQSLFEVKMLRPCPGRSQICVV